MKDPVEEPPGEWNVTSAEGDKHSATSRAEEDKTLTSYQRDERLGASLS